MQPRTIIACSCGGSLTPDPTVIARACPDARIEVLRDPAGADLARLVALAGTAGELTVACACQQSRIAAALEDAGIDRPVSMVNIREPALWSRSPAAAGPKAAALIALAAEPALDVPMISLESQGITVIYGRDEIALEVATRLADDLDITVLLDRPGTILPARNPVFPIYRGSIRTAAGRLGGFSLAVDDFASPQSASRGQYVFGPARNGTSSQCDLIIDLTGGKPLFPAHDLRPGYLRAEPNDRAGIERLIGEARDLVGTFDKPRYITFRPELCAHSRSRITGCTRCLDVCPTGAVAPAGDSVAIDPAICAGCGGCGALCPTGAASYALPAPDVVLTRLRSMLNAYHAAGGEVPVLLLHDAEHGEELLHLAAHTGAGLPAEVLPFALNEITQIGLEILLSAFAYGAVAVRVLSRTRPRHDQSALETTLALASTILSGLGFSADAVFRIAADEPEALASALAGIASGPRTQRRATFLPAGSRRQLLRLSLRELHAVAPHPATAIALPGGSPMGRVSVEAAGCTLCLACVSACPADALRANPERPELRFVEDLCIQCGLCARTCPEQVISLEPRLDFAALDAGPVLLKEEDPHACERCGKLFGTRATIRRIREKLGTGHWMYSGGHARRIDLIGLCDDCRVLAATEQGIDPYAAAPRPKPRTAEDYRRTAEGIDLDPNADE